MYIIPWDSCSTTTKKSIIADIGDIRLILTKQSSGWVLSMGIRVYGKDRSCSMVRPPVTVMQIPQSCELEDAKKITQDYFNDFLSSVLDSLK